MSKDKRANCAALQLVIDAARKSVWQTEAILKLHGHKVEKDEELDTAILMMQRYVDENKL